MVVRVLGKSGQRAGITRDADGGEPGVSTGQIREPVGALWREEDASPSVAAKLGDRDGRLERIAQLLHGDGQRCGDDDLLPGLDLAQRLIGKSRTEGERFLQPSRSGHSDDESRLDDEAILGNGQLIAGNRGSCDGRDEDALASDRRILPLPAVEELDPDDAADRAWPRIRCAELDGHHPVCGRLERAECVRAFLFVRGRVETRSSDRQCRCVEDGGGSAGGVRDEHGALAPEVDHHRLQNESVRFVRLVCEGNLLSRFQLDQQRGCVGGVVAVVIVDDDSLDGIAEHQSLRLLDREKAPGERWIARVAKRLDVPRILDLHDAALAEDLEKPQQGHRMEIVDGRVDRKLPRSGAEQRTGSVDGGRIVACRKDEAAEFHVGCSGLVLRQRDPFRRHRAIRVPPGQREDVVHHERRLEDLQVLQRVEQRGTARRPFIHVRQPRGAESRLQQAVQKQRTVVARGTVCPHELESVGRARDAQGFGARWRLEHELDHFRAGRVRRSRLPELCLVDDHLIPDEDARRLSGTQLQVIDVYRVWRDSAGVLIRRRKKAALDLQLQRVGVACWRRDPVVARLRGEGRSVAQHLLQRVGLPAVSGFREH